MILYYMSMWYQIILYDMILHDVNMIWYDGTGWRWSLDEDGMKIDAQMELYNGHDSRMEWNTKMMTIKIDSRV